MIWFSSPQRSGGYLPVVDGSPREDASLDASSGAVGLEPAAREFYAGTLLALGEAGVDVLLGGAYAFAAYTGIERHTKDLDVFVRPEDAGAALDALAARGYRTELSFPHWLGKAHGHTNFVDVIFGSGNGVAPVDEGWFEHASPAEVWDVPVRLVAPEEMLWHKCFVQERERFDGADVLHVLRARADALDWERLLERFGPYWRVLLAHLVMFGFVYPGDRARIPPGVMLDLLGRARDEAGAPGEAGVCMGPLVSRSQYAPDIERFGLRDGRVSRGHMSASDARDWTRAGRENQE